jgi:hypothetical protein
MTTIADPWTWISVIIGIGAAYCVFPLEYRVLRMRSWLQNVIDAGGNLLFLRCCQFVLNLAWLVFVIALFMLTPALTLKPFIYCEIYLYSFVAVAFAKSFKFRRKMISLGLDPKTEQRRRAEISKTA